MSSSNDLLQLRVAKYLLSMELARRKTLNFCQITKADWQTAKHHLLLTDKMDEVIDGTLPGIIINLPPRHTKSEIFSVRGPARLLGVHPEKRILHVSYASQLSNTFSIQVRAMIRDNPTYHELFPNTNLHSDRQRVDDWYTTEGGGMKSVGVGAGISGHGADIIILDDLVKEGDEKSPTILRDTIDWLYSACLTRLSPGGSVLAVGTRWAVNDVSGELMANSGFPVISLPAIALENDPLGREPGEALWPERFPVSHFSTIRINSPLYFEALFQQNPQPTQGKLFDKNWFYEWSEFDFLNVYGSQGVWCFDLAISEKDSADYSVYGRCQFAQGYPVFISDLHRVQQQWPDVKDDIISLMHRYPEDLFVFPPQTYELVALQELSRLGSSFAARLRTVKMSGDKRGRAAHTSALFKLHGVLVEPSQHSEAFILEHDRFPDRNDDCVDMTSVYSHHLAGLSSPFSIVSVAQEFKPLRLSTQTPFGEVRL